MDAVLDRVKNVATPITASSGVVPGPTDVTVWINDVQYLLPSHLLGDGAKVCQSIDNQQETIRAD